MTSFIMDLIGWAGAGLLLTPYLLLSFGKLSGQSKIYQGLNITGSAALIANSAYYGALPSAFVNIVWIVIGIIALSAAMKTKRRAKNVSF